MDITILGIESSCDDTSAAVIRNNVLLSNVIASQAVHVKYGGVIPELASRAHQQNIVPVVDTALREAGVAADKLDAIAFTRGPGLLGSLLVGVSFAKGLSIARNIPMVEVNHLQGHILSHFIDLPDRQLPHPDFPFLCLLVSGGHTQIVRVDSPLEMRIVGTTIDDASGEAFDKCAKAMGLPYPGGPSVQQLAESGAPCINFPSALVKNSQSLRFSYSGLKTAVINYCHNAQQRGEELKRADVAASFQRAAVDPLVKKTVECALKCGVKTVTAGGGVIANSYLRSTLSEACRKAGLKLVLPEKKYCTDNAAMIASEGLNQYTAGNFSPMSTNAVAAIPLK